MSLFTLYGTRVFAAYIQHVSLFNRNTLMIPHVSKIILFANVVDGRCGLLTDVLSQDGWHLLHYMGLWCTAVPHFKWPKQSWKDANNTLSSAWNHYHGGRYFAWMAVLWVRVLKVVLHCTGSVISVCGRGTDELGLDYLEILECALVCEKAFFVTVRMIGYN